MALMRAGEKVESRVGWQEATWSATSFGAWALDFPPGLGNGQMKKIGKRGFPRTPKSALTVRIASVKVPGSTQRLPPASKNLLCGGTLADRKRESRISVGQRHLCRRPALSPCYREDTWESTRPRFGWKKRRPSDRPRGQDTRPQPSGRVQSRTRCDSPPYLFVAGPWCLDSFRSGRTGGENTATFCIEVSSPFAPRHPDIP
jgi:hypothetical protein